MTPRPVHTRDGRTVVTLGTDTGSTAGPTDAPAPAPPAGAEVRPVRPRHTARWVAIGVLVIAAGLVAVLATRPSARRSPRPRAPWSGSRPRLVSGTTVHGTRFTLPARVPGTSWC